MLNLDPALLEAAQDAVVVRDREGRVLLWSRGAEALYGWRSADALGSRAHALLRTHFPEAPAHLDGFAWATAELERMGTWEGEVTQDRRDGSQVLVELRWSRAPGDGQPVLEVGRDVTLRRRAASALAQLVAAVQPAAEDGAREPYRGIFENATEGMFFATPERREVTVNPAMARIFGYASPADLVQASPDLRDLLALGEGARLDTLLAERGPIRGLEIEGRRRDGSPVWACLDVVPIQDGDGRVAGYQGMVVDVSDRRDAEASLRRAMEEARRASLAKTEFLSRTSHELRTPLAATMGFAQLLAREPLTEVQSEYVAHILRAGRHLLDLINEVLEIARIEQGRLGLSLAPVPVAAAVEEALQLIRPQADQRGVTVLTSPPSGPHTHVQADRQRLYQVLVNLLSNAVKYNREGGSITLSTEDAGGGGVRISVADTGLGIPADQQALAFAPFERLGAERGGVEGTGLGLALSRGLVEAMGGSLGMHSEPGLGSTFWVVLPASTAPLAAHRSWRTGSAPAVAPAAGATVLYIEDNASNQRLMEGLLTHRAGTALLAASRGAEGLALAKERRPSLVLLDLHLPDMAGTDVLAALRADPATAALPVVVLSADATHQSIQRLLDSGATAYLTKPFDIDEFLALLDHLLP